MLSSQVLDRNFVYAEGKRKEKKVEAKWKKEKVGAICYNPLVIKKHREHIRDPSPVWHIVYQYYIYTVTKDLKPEKQHRKDPEGQGLKSLYTVAG